MSLDQISLKSFIVAADTKNFTKTSQIVNRSQSAVSQQIARLEEFVDKELFIREKDMELTSDGEIFLSYAKQIFKLQQELIDRFKSPEIEGEVKFGVPEDFATAVLSDVLVNFARIHPRISLQVECDLTLNLYEKFQNNQFDLVLLKMSRPQDFPSGVEIWSEKLQWVGDEKLIARNSCGQIDKSQTIPLVLSPQPCVYAKKAIDALECTGLKWKIAFKSESYASKIAAVKAGLGVTVFPRNMVGKDLPIISDDKIAKLDDTHLSLLKRNEDSAAINSFEEFALKKLKYL